MVIVILVILGLCLGSFVNAAVWRLHEQSKKKKPSRKLSIVHGRSMCVHCGHELVAEDLIPLISWLSLGGKCRYCGKPISPQYPMVEALTAVLFVLSYLYWPISFDGQGITLFTLWLLILTGLVALCVYDLKWYLLPDKVVRPLFVLALLQVVLIAAAFGGGRNTLFGAFWGLIVGGGIFYVLFQVSGGKWIGGGDVKLGAVLGLVIGGPGNAFLMLFFSSLLGTVVALPLMLTGKVGRTSKLPFGPFLIMAAIIAYLFGASIIAWYKKQFLFY
jgi:prepilin signal peptidase PulO-like enzyme (type II secretory pathway)